MFVYSGHVMTLANSIIGVGILAMPFCFQKCGILLAILLLIVSNWITRICCHYLIKCSLLTRRKSFEFLGFHAFGTSGKLLVELCIIGYLLGTCITYFVVVGDIGPQIVTKMLALDSPHVHLRTWIMIAVTLVCILPLGMLKNVDSLSTVCTASIGFYVCLVLKIVLESEDHILASDWTGQVKYWEPAGVLQCLPIFSMALSCQMQLFEVFESINNQSLEKLNGIVKNATWICTFVYIAVGFFGYVAFCTQTFSGNILVNLSESFGSDVIKIGFVLSVAFSFPLVIFPCRASIYSLLYRKGHTDATGYIPEARFKAITIVIVGLALCIALMIPSVELIIGLVGSTIGVAICIMFPASCFRKIVKKETTERSLAQLILVSGFCLMILGTYANLNAIDMQRSGAHLEVPASIEESLKLPTAMPEIKIKPVIKEIEINNLSQAEQVQEEQINLPESIQNLNEAKGQNVGIPEKPIIEEKPSPPPLPVDEKHDDEEELILAKKEQSSAKLVENETEKPEVVVKLELLAPAANQTQLADIAKNNTSLNSLTTTQGINSDAINKEEEIAAEELKSDKTAKSAANDELKKTQNELKKTKELLKRTVGELKEELAKQNKETQNLVAEKLGQVVEKVEKIEREVNEKETKEKEDKEKVKKMEQQAKMQKGTLTNKVAEQIKQNENFTNIERSETDDEQKKVPKAVLKNNDVLVEEPKPDPKRRNKGSLMSMLAAEENAKENLIEEKLPAKPKVYEPISYKTGELIENVRNASNLEQRLRLPLPLLINASTSQGKANDANVKAKLTQAAVKPEPNNSQKVLNRNEVPNELKQSQNIADVKIKNLSAEETKKVQKENETDKENIEAIRRDLLQLKSFQLDENAATSQQQRQEQQQQQHERVKRSSQLEHKQLNFNDLPPQQLDQKNCLSSANVEQALTMSLKNVIDFHTGRQLKANENQDNN